MRLYLLPISTRRTLLYAQRLSVTTKPSSEQSYADRAVNLAASQWAKWEKKESGWQRRVVDYGNNALRRIPYEEWGLKSVPPLSSRRRNEELQGKDKVELAFPRSVVPLHKAEGILKTLATERQALHKKRLIYCVLCMPLTIPVGLIPVLPNLPFLYLLYRAWSHWKAILGGKHIQWLIQNKLIREAPSDTLDELYKSTALPLDDSKEAPEKMLLSEKQVEAFSEKLEIPPLAIELERAVWQVERALKTDAEKKEQQQSSEDAKSSTISDPSKHDKKE